METVRERLDRAQASGNRAEIRQALIAAREAGADDASIEQALAELDRLGPDASEQEAAEKRTRAEGLKKRGNECLKSNTKSAAREALEFFTAGLEVHCEDRVLNAQLFGNRAHVRILLRQYVEAVDDCRKAIELDPKNMKSYFRAAKASLNLDLCRNGIEFCEAGLRVTPDDADLMRLRTTCAEKLAAQQQKRAEMAQARGSGGDFNADEAMAVQERVNNLSEQCEMMKGSMMQKQRERHKAELTEKNLGDIPEDTNMYIGVGRTFVMESRETINKKLRTKLDSLQESMPSLEKAHQEMEKRKEAAEQELKEIIHSFRQQQAA